MQTQKWADTKQKKKMKKRASVAILVDKFEVSCSQYLSVLQSAILFATYTLDLAISITNLLDLIPLHFIYCVFIILVISLQISI